MKNLSISRIDKEKENYSKKYQETGKTSKNAVSGRFIL